MSGQDSADKAAPLSAEDKLIARFFEPLAVHPGALALKDDAAFMTPPPGHDIVLKTDAIVGGVHFFPGDPPDLIARKALRVNLSDLAAKGAKPAGCLVSLALDAQCDAQWLSAFAAGLREDTQRFDCPLFGGDTDRTPGPVTVAVFVFGFVPGGSMVRRAGAKPGDQIVVTGTIGDAALGLRLCRQPRQWSLDAKANDHLIDRYLLPRPRVALAEAVRQHASAAMDVSDGLAGDLAKLCRVSGVGARVQVAQVPLSDAARSALSAEPALIEPILTGGDDYEVLCAIAPAHWNAFRAAAEAAQVAVARIGEIAPEGAGVRFLDARGEPMHFARPSFSHF